MCYYFYMAINPENDVPAARPAARRPRGAAHILVGLTRVLKPEYSIEGRGTPLHISARGGLLLRYALLIFILLNLTACVSSSFEYVGGQSDYDECRYQASLSSGPPLGLVYLVQRAENIKWCMKARGYAQTK